MKQAEYRKTQQGDGYQFHVTPAPKVLGGCSGIFFILLLAFVGAMLAGAILNQYLAILVFIGIAVFAFLKMDMRKKNHRNPSTFFVDTNKIEVNGQTIEKSSIHRIIIRNAYDNSPKIQLTGQTVPTGVGVGHDIRNALEQISYSVDIEANGKATQLAGGMDEVTANGLYTEVCRILGI
jgi:hypothetical protein